ncbi:hypothetical protein [Citrobacter sp. JGM124]|uniref:hypothetical protein n=1 Tax=Citrobacter sp. JGM124 TaxID=2799789 RepID=UPI001BA5258A|nr:hypothetical protein [Citrobacter sp. JGM124]MBS0849352.1 hypothetical protein [Citrobacter sp. JGM124]
MKILLSIMFVFLLSFSNFSFALDCYAVINNVKETTDSESVADIIIPESAQNGEIIWRSMEYTRNIYCDKADVDEYVYFYPFPDKTTLPAGMSFGLVYNGKTYDLTTSKIQTDIHVSKGGSQTGQITVQVFIKKTGNISSGFNGDLAIYQLDGQGGINSNNDAKNFKFSLKNLSNIATGNCTYSLNGIPSTKPININDNLISNGQTLTSIGSASVSCTPVDLLKNRIVNMKLYTNSSSGNSLFSTDKSGLGYQLSMSGKTILPSTTSSSPVEINFSLDANGNATKNFDQNIFLTNADETWLYQNNQTTATSTNPNLAMSIDSFE